MHYRKLGNTGLDVSVLSFGASSLGSVFRETDERESIRTVHAAIDAGINYIDVSPYYGLTRAETVLGKAIREIPRDKFLLSTKAGRYGVDAFDFSAGRIQSSLEESLTRLHTDYVDLFFLHDIEFVPAEIVLEEAVPAAMRLKEQGKIRYWGISGLPLQLFEKMLPQIDADVILSYCHYSPLSMGLLSLRGTPDWHPASPELKAVCKKAAEYCASRGTDIAKLAVQFSTANERIPTTLVSTANPDNIARNARWALEPIDEELLREVLELLEPVHNVTWVSGRPEYNENIRV